MTTRVVIVGAGETGRALAGRLAAHHQVLLLDHQREQLELTGPSIEPGQVASEGDVRPGATAVRGDGTS
ncbi:MAG: NAD-binding protein, partial [Deltaproteobacteria bacterium]|nr:NAD-binding protein [Deltaproteobacteria bacterium]